MGNIGLLGLAAGPGGGALLGVSLLYIFFMLKTKGLQRPGVFLRL